MMLGRRYALQSMALATKFCFFVRECESALASHLGARSMCEDFSFFLDRLSRLPRSKAMRVILLTTFSILAGFVGLIAAEPVSAQHEHEARGHAPHSAHAPKDSTTSPSARDSARAPIKTDQPAPKLGAAPKHDHSSHSGHGSHNAAAKTAGEISSDQIQIEIPDVTLRNRQDEPVSLSELLDTPQTVILNFVFTTCNAICPVMSSAFSGFGNLVGDDLGDYRLISISIDPEFDTPEQLTAYAERHNARGDWHFLTGQIEDIRSTQRAFGAFRGSKMNHEPATYLFRKGVGQWVRLNGLATPTQIFTEAAKIRGKSNF